ncbi:MAG: ATP-binding protein [Actinomycetia bacterium]|nr:ATP-binding protein [Actinomycetes bacterium]
MASALFARNERRRLVGLVLKIRAAVYWLAGISVLLVPGLTSPSRLVGLVSIALATGLPFVTRRTGKYSGVRLSATIDIAIAYILWIAVPSASAISLILTIWAVTYVVFLGTGKAAERTAAAAVIAELSKLVLLVLAPSNELISEVVRFVAPDESALILARSAAIVGAYLVFRSVDRYVLKLNAAAESSSERFRRLMDSAPTAFFIVIDQTVAYANEMACSLLDVRISDLVESDFIHLIEPDRRSEAQYALGRATAQLESVNLTELRLMTASEDERWVDLTMHAVDFGYELAVQVAVLDRSAQRRAEDQLKRSEVGFRSFFERIPVPLYRSRPDGTILEANDALVSLFGGRSKTDVVGQDARRFYVDAGEREYLTSILGDRGVVVGYEARMSKVDGSQLWVRDTSRRIETEAGPIYEGAMIDVTDRHRIEDELWSRAVQQEAAAAIGQVALEADVITDVMQSVSETVSTVLGTEGSVVLERSGDGQFAMHGSTGSLTIDADAVSVIADRAHMTAASVVLRTEQEVLFAAPELARQGIGSAVAVMIPGAEIDFGTLVVVARDERVFTADDLNFLQSVANVLAAAVDRARANERLEDLLKSKDAFVASVSHELRTPLTVVAGMAHELNDRWKDFTEAEMDEFTLLLVEQSRDMSDLIDDLLIAARSNIGNVMVRSERVPLGEQVTAVLAGFVPNEGKSIVSSIESGYVDADPIRVRQILRNLMTNALRYGGDNISVRMVVSAGAIAVEVSDDGPGIPVTDRDRIFLAYERAHSTVGQPGSVGIGLTVSRTLADLMGGSLTYEFRDSSVFTLELPRDLTETATSAVGIAVSGQLSTRAPA